MESVRNKIIEVVKIHDDLGIYGPIGHSYTANGASVVDNAVSQVEHVRVPRVNEVIGMEQLEIRVENRGAATTSNVNVDVHDNSNVVKVPSASIPVQVDEIRKSDEVLANGTPNDKVDAVTMGGAVAPTGGNDDVHSERNDEKNVCVLKKRQVKSESISKLRPMIKKNSRVSREKRQINCRKKSASVESMRKQPMRKAKMRSIA